MKRTTIVPALITTNPVILRGYERDAENLEIQAKQLREQARAGWEAIVKAERPEIVRPIVDRDEWAWDCPNSPTEKCVYDWQAYGEPSCVYCGDPEERK